MPTVYTYVYIQAIKNCGFTSQPNGVSRPMRRSGVCFRTSGRRRCKSTRRANTRHYPRWRPNQIGGLGIYLIRSQRLILGKPLVYGQSITDACCDWAETHTLLKELAAAVGARRTAGQTGCPTSRL